MPLFDQTLVVLQELLANKFSEILTKLEKKKIIIWDMRVTL